VIAACGRGSQNQILSTLATLLCEASFVIVERQRRVLGPFFSCPFSARDESMGMDESNIWPEPFGRNCAHNKELAPKTLGQETDSDQADSPTLVVEKLM
jgi:hypothetical protein